MSPADLSKSHIGKGIRVNVSSYHFKALAGWGLLEVVDQIAGGDHSAVRYAVTDQLTQSMVDAAALRSISEVVESIPRALAQWIEGPYVDEIHALVQAAGHSALGGNCVDDASS
jgi:hypothetical protein